ncbi:CHASE domain-containing protein [Luteimonas aestuarii]|nr:CHASE domain-containing protein [Luteimonas aestuarii]
MQGETGKPASTPVAATRWRFRRGYLLAVLVLVASLMVVALYARKASEREDRLTEAEYVAIAERTANALQERMLRYELAIRGGVSLFASVSRPSERQWQAYVDGLNLHAQFPGLMGLGYVPYLDSEGLKQLQMEKQQQGDGLFVLRPAGIREFYGPIVFLEPRTIANREALGFDMFSEPDRQAAMVAARDTGQVSLTAPVALLQLTGQDERTGLLLYAPIYAGGVTPSRQASRRTTMAGWIYVPFAVNAYVGGVTSASPGQFALRIVDTTAAPAEVYRDPRFSGEVQGGAWRYSLERAVYGRTWRLEFEELAPSRSARIDDLQMTLAAGLVVSLLLFAVVLSLAHTQTRAERIAARMADSWRRSELRFRSAMEYSAAGVALLDADDRIVEANPALEVLFGAAPDSLGGTSLTQRLLDPDAPWRAERGPRVAEDGAYRTTQRVLDAKGDERRLLLVFSAVPGDAGGDAAWLVQAEDITDRLRAEEQVRSMNRLLEARVTQRTRELTQANRELESFAYSVSHDLRAPLRSVEGFARVLAERHAATMDEDGLGYLARIRNAARRMDALIDALLKLSRIGRDTLRLDELDISRIASDIVGELRQAEPDREVEVWIEAGLRAAGDAALVRDLLQNLIGNAWKFTRESAAAKIELCAAPDLADATAHGAGEGGRLCAFIVRDNGAGFDPDYAGKLFRAFQRLHEADRFAGHGIGLATVKRIVERHGGQIEADGRPGEGASFRFTLPHVDAAGHEPDAG